MNITLYNQSNENNVVDKKLSGGFQLSGNLKQACSVQNPVILIEAQNLASYNYMYLSDFKRYYFITEIICVNSGLWEVRGRVDVLNSFKSGIKKNKAIILRTEDERYTDKLFDDNIIASTLRVDRHNEIINFPNKEFSVNDAGTSETSIPFMLITTGNGGTNI